MGITFKSTIGFVKRARRELGRSFASSGTYIDDWYNEIRKSKDFYERFASGKPRCYFYNIDFQGRLFLEETSPKNVATSIKDEKFLDFFFARIRLAKRGETDLLIGENVSQDYPFVSVCGPEINFIRPAVTPIVFHSLVGDELIYGGTIGVRLESHRLAISNRSGKLYYRLSHDRNAESIGRAGLEYGLIASSVGILLSDRISVQGEDKFLLDNNTPIDWLPKGCEPGSWAMPNHG